GAQGGALWGVRCRPGCRLGERRLFARHGAVCRREHPALVARHGGRAVPTGGALAELRRCRGEQRLPAASVEVRTPALGGRGRAGRDRVSLPAGHEQVEQDRAPTVLPHHDKLAGPAVGQLSRDRESHCGDEDGYGVARAGRVGYTAVSDQGESDQKANGNGPLATPRVSRRVELYSQTPIAQHVNVIYLQALTGDDLKDFPVEQVSCADAEDFIEKLNQREK